MTKIADIIKYEGDNSTFIWKHPAEDFNSLTQLIVHESQEAIFFMNGQALDLFGPGRYTLETQNIPKIGKILNRTTGGKDPFHCEVYFINKTVQMALKWGTDSKVRFIDPLTGVPLELGASGEINMQVTDSRKLLVKLVGTMNGIAWEYGGTNFTKSIKECFRPLVSVAVKSNLSNVIKSENIDILDIDEKLELISEKLKEKVAPGFEEYGISIPDFYVTNVVLPESDPNFRRIRDLHTVSLQTRIAEAEATVRTAQAESAAAIAAAQRQVELERQTTETAVARMQAERDVIDAQAKAEAVRLAGLAEAEVMRAQGYNQKDVIQADVQKAYAAGIGNMGSEGGNGGTSIMGEMLGLGVGLAAAGSIAPQVGEMIKGIGNVPQTSETVICPKCGATLPAGAKFCFLCGEKIEAAPEKVVCPSCGKETPKGKFCMECGAPLENKCLKCGAEIPAGAKFCPLCGEKL